MLKRKHKKTGSKILLIIALLYGTFLANFSFAHTVYLTTGNGTGMQLASRDNCIGSNGWSSGSMGWDPTFVGLKPPTTYYYRTTPYIWIAGSWVQQSDFDSGWTNSPASATSASYALTSGVNYLGAWAYGWSAQPGILYYGSVWSGYCTT